MSAVLENNGTVTGFGDGKVEGKHTTSSVAASIGFVALKGESKV